MKSYEELSEKENKAKILKANDNGVRHVEIAGEIIGDYEKDRSGFRHFVLITPLVPDDLPPGKLRRKIEIKVAANITRSIKEYSKLLWNTRFLGFNKAMEIRTRDYNEACQNNTKA